MFTVREILEKYNHVEEVEFYIAEDKRNIISADNAESLKNAEFLTDAPDFAIVESWELWSSEDYEYYFDLPADGEVLIIVIERETGTVPEVERWENPTFEDLTESIYYINKIAKYYRNLSKSADRESEREQAKRKMEKCYKIKSDFLSNQKPSCIHYDGNQYFLYYEIGKYSFHSITDQEEIEKAGLEIVKLNDTLLNYCDCNFDELPCFRFVKNTLEKNGYIIDFDFEEE